MDERNLSKEAQKYLRAKGFPLVHLHRCDDNLFSFSAALEEAIDNNEFGPYVDKHSSEELRSAHAAAFLSRNQKAGIAVWPDGNIRAVFKDKRSPIKNAIGELMLTALAAGGNKLDCFDGILRVIYSKFGFIPVARVRFDPKFQPENWNEKKFGRPDIIFWMHCGDSVEKVAENIGNYPKYTNADIASLPCFEDYDIAFEYRDNMLEELKNGAIM